MVTGNGSAEERVKDAGAARLGDVVRPAELLKNRKDVKPIVRELYSLGARSAS